MLKYFTDKELKTVCPSVKDFSDLSYLKELEDICIKENGLAIAANQIGILKRAIFFNFENGSFYMINPEIISSSEKTVSFKEGCLSIPGVFSPVKRASTVTVKFYTLLNEEKTETFYGLESACVQHEIDHLNGITMLDRVSFYKRSNLLKKALKILKNKRM